MFLYHDKVKMLNYLTGKQLVDKLKDTIQSDDILKQTFCPNNTYNEKELRAWENSVPAIVKVLCDAGLGDLEIILEYSIPYLSERMDVIVVGRNHNNHPTALIIELKQWKSIVCDKMLDATKVRIPEDGADVTITREHPCSQVYGYTRLLHDNHAIASDENKIAVEDIAYLHNFEEKAQLFDGPYSAWKKYQDRVFVKDQESELKAYLKKLFVSEACERDYLLITEGAYQNPPDFFASIDKVLADQKYSALAMEQRTVQSRIFDAIKKYQKEKTKLVFIVSGGPGTGKSVLGLYCMSFYSQWYDSQSDLVYATQNRTLKEVITSYISDENKKYRSSIVNAYNCLKSSDHIPFLIIDEAQRLEEIDTILPRLIEKCSVLLLLQDDRQRVKLKEKGTRENLIRIASQQKNISIISDLFLTTNHRNGFSPVYEKVINRFLYGELIEGNFTGNFGDYDVKISERLLEIEDFLNTKKIEGNRCKWLAPYCWTWNRNDEWDIDISIAEEDFQKPWNPKELSSQAEWYKDEEVDGNKRLDQVGCVYTSQGLDFDYVGLIVWDDLYWSDGKWQVDLNKNKDYTFVEDIVRKYDGRLINTGNGFCVWYKKQKYIDINVFLRSRNADMDEIVQLVLNTYYVLFTRAKKGIRIWFKDEKTKEYFCEISGL